MTREEILQEVKKRLIALESKVDVPSEELLFFRDFISKNSFNSIVQILKLEAEPVFKAYFLSEVDGLDYEDVSEVIKTVMPLLEADDPNDELLDVCGELNEVWSKMTLKCLDAIEKSKGVFSKMFQETKFEVEVNNMLNEVFQKHPNFQKYQTAAKAYIALTQMLVDTIENDTGKEKDKIEEEIAHKSLTMLSAISLVRFIFFVKKAYAESFEMYDKMTNRELAKITLDKKQSATIKRKILKVIGDSLDWQNINDGYNGMVAYYKKLEKELNKKSLTRTKSTQAYRDFFSYFVGLDESKEITGYRSIVQNIPDEDLKKEILTYIYNRNLEKQEKVESDYQTLVGSGKTAYYSILESYAIPRTDETISRLQSKYNKEQVASSLEQLSSLGIEDPNLLYQILLVSDEETIISLTSFFADKEIISKETLKAHPKIFDPNSTCYNNAMQNIDTIIDNGINPKYLYGNPATLFAEPALVKENFASLQESALTTSIGKDSDISFLGNAEMKTKLSLATLSGNRKALTENISLLNAPTSGWKKVQIMNFLSMPVSEEKLPAFLESDSFFIPDSKLDDYLFEPCEVQEIVTYTKKHEPSKVDKN